MIEKKAKINPRGNVALAEDLHAEAKIAAAKARVPLQKFVSDAISMRIGPLGSWHELLEQIAMSENKAVRNAVFDALRSGATTLKLTVPPGPFLLKPKAEKP